MDKIFTASTSTNQWQNLVSEACQSCKVTINEEIESYLVFLLMRFIDAPQLANKVMSTEFLTSISKSGSLRPLALREVGDQCLLYSGLFPGRAVRRQVRVSYYVNIGKSAYFSLANSSIKSSDNSLFTTLADKFVSLMDILQTMREINTPPQAQVLDPITAEEIWHDTGSNHALETLQKFTVKAILPTSSLELSTLKH